MNELIQFLSKLTALTEEEISFLRKNLAIRSLKKGDFLLKQGEVSTAFYFVVQGSVRLYYSVGIEERTAFFYLENEFVSAYESFTKQVPSKHSFQCIEDTQVVEITLEQSATLLTRFPNFEFLAREMMERELATYQDIIASFIMLSPQERYLKLQKERPDILNRIPQYYLATYIGVKPESLSRIRKRIAEN